MKKLFTIFAAIVLLAACEKPSAEPSVKPEAGSTIYGQVSCNGKGIEGVVVSDGYEVSVTGKNGVYQLKSEKKNGYVFISTPSGYDTFTTGVIPQFFKYLKAAPTKAERADFVLTEADQTDCTILFFGDIHLAGRSFCHGIDQFREFTADVRTYTQGRKTYAITLGDMSWDVYWKNGYDLPFYLGEITDGLRGIPVSHTMGNHDNDPTQAGDLDAAGAFHTHIGPNWYSFNLAGTHYIVLDDIDYINNPIGERNFSARIPDEELSWLRKDLSFIGHSTPLIVTCHVPFYRLDGSDYIRNVKQVVDLLKPYSRVDIVSGHTHVKINTDHLSTDHIFEHNAGAVCGGWWVSGSNYPGLLLCADGAPGGYEILTVTNGTSEWQYKATSRPLSHQFRTYDDNKIIKDNKNTVRINLWDWTPDWTLSVTENGKQLPVKQLKNAYDPLYDLVYVQYQKSHGYNVSYPADETSHIFQVTASSPTSTLHITATSPSGHTYTETMSRPKPFTPSSY